MKETLIRAMGQICNIQVVDKNSKIKSFNLKKGRRSRHNPRKTRVRRWSGDSRRGGCFRGGWGN